MPRLTKDIIPTRTVGARVKKAKVVFDPSVNNLPKKRSIKALSVSEDVNPVQKAKDNKTKNTRRLSTRSLINNSFPDEEKVNKTSRNGGKNNNRRYSRRDSRRDSRKSTPPPILDIEPEEEKVEIQQITNNDTCVVCEKSETNKRNKKLIPCKDCNYKIHPGCLKINFQNPNLAEERWRCKNCKTCVVCDETREAGYLLTCCVCVDAYHFNCHTPKLQRSDVNKVKWECYKCSYIMKQTLPNKISLIDEEFNQNAANKILPSSAQMINNTKTANIEIELSKKTQNNDDTRFVINPVPKIISESRSSLSLSTSSSIKTNNNKRCRKLIMKPKSIDESEIKNNNRHTPPLLDNECELNELSLQTKKMKLENNENELKSSSKNDINKIITNKKYYKDICISEYFYKFFKSENEIPDISKFSHEQMAEFIEKYLPNEAYIFREQEIDGRSCLLMKRSDIVNCFDLKVGPAIRLYCLIVVLQTKARDMSLTWM